MQKYTEDDFYRRLADIVLDVGEGFHSGKSTEIGNAIRRAGLPIAKGAPDHALRDDPIYQAARWASRTQIKSVADVYRAQQKATRAWLHYMAL